MRSGNLALVLFSSIFLLAGTPPNPTVPAQLVDLAQEPASVMTGTVEERNAFIRKSLEQTGSEKTLIKQITIDGVELTKALQFLRENTKIDIVVRWDELKKQGIDRDVTVNLDIYNRTFPEVLELLLWQLRPAAGHVGWKIDNGILAIVPLADVPPAQETALQIQQDAEIKAALRKPPPATILGKEMPAFYIVYSVSLPEKIGMVIDYTELHKAGISDDPKLTLDKTSPTGEDALKAALAALKPDKGEAAYEIWGGVIRISTRERLDKEKPKADADLGIPK